MRAALVIDALRTGGKDFAKQLYRRPLIACAPILRRMHAGTRFIGITGSGGKTTTKDLAYEVLKSRYRAHKSHDSNNQLYTVARTMLEFLPGAEFCVQEIGISEPGALDAPVNLLRPSIVVVTNIRTDHCAAFKDEDAIAAEKCKLVRALAPDGIAILNADDDRVLAMAAQCPGRRVVTYGFGAHAQLRVSGAVSEWPGGLRFVLHHGGQSFEGRTALHGTHLVLCAVAAVAVGIAAGMSVPDCLAAIRDFRPRLGRMFVHGTRGGVTFVRDDWKSPYWSICEPMDFVRALPARRKLLVLGTISDYRGTSYPRYRHAVTHALGVFNEVLLVGPHASKAQRLAKLLGAPQVRGFTTVEEAAKYVREIAGSGDVVLLKGSNASEHLSRIALAFDKDVRCWRTKCRRDIFCDACALLSVPART